MPATHPFPRRAGSTVAPCTAGEGAGLPKVCGASDRLLLRKLVLQDDVLVPEGSAGARNESGVQGLEEALELGRPTEVPPTERPTEDSAAVSRSSAKEGRVLALKSFAWKPTVGTAVHAAGSFSLSGETDLATCGASGSESA